MTATKSDAAKSRMSIYISDANRKRLDRVPRGQKTQLVNQALEQVLSNLERQENFNTFLKTIKALKPVAVSKSGAEMLHELRETGTIKPNKSGK